MGLAWCRERVEQAHNSKSPVDRILVWSSNMIKPRTTYSHSQGKIVNDFVYKGMRTKNLGISHPVPIHAVPPRTRNRMQRNSDWHTCTLTVEDLEDHSKPPIPPPRKKRKRKLNPVEVLNNQLPELHSPSYVIYSENLLSKKFANVDSAETNERDVLPPLEKSYYREKTSGSERFGKLSGNRTRKIKGESHPNEAKEKRIKNDNEKKTEQKIKHVSTVSLPNYNELIKPSRKVSTDVENGDDKTGNRSVGLKNPRRNSSTISLPGEGSNSILSSLSEATIHRLETYMKRCRSFGALKPQQLLEKLEEFNKSHRSGSESSDSWSGLDDWDLGVIEYCDPDTSNAPPLTPKSTLPPKQVTFSSVDNQSRDKEESEEVKVPEVVETIPEGKTPIIQRCESIIEGVPLEWFLDPQLRPPAIMPPPVESEPVKYVKTPPPSPEGIATEDIETPVTDDHSSLLSILRKYKDEEVGEPELQINIKEIVLEKDPMTFTELDVELPPKKNLNPFLPEKNRSNSLTGEQINREKVRSPSIGFENSAHLLEQLRRNSEAIEKEILLKPKELIKGLRRESLCQSLPEDAFEAYVNKRKPSMRESLNEFLGFGNEKKPDQADDEKPEKASDDNTKGEELSGAEERKKGEKVVQSSAPPLPLNPPPIVIINSPPVEDDPPVPHSLVKTNDNPNGI